MTPPAEGTNRLQVWAVDRAGNVSDEPEVYYLKVGAGAGPVGIWHLDGIGVETVAHDATSHRRDATVDRMATPWATGKLGNALRFNGNTGLALGSTAPMRTDESFAVSAWVKLTAADSNTGVVMSQDGAANSNFQLHYSGVEKAWVFGMRTTPSATTAVRVFSREPAVAGHWTHLTGVFNAGAKDDPSLRGRRRPGHGSGGDAVERHGPGPGGPQPVGRHLHQHVQGAHRRGAGRYDRLLQASDVHDLAVVEAATLELRLPLDEGAGAVGADVSGHYRNLTLSGAASWVSSKNDDEATAMGEAVHFGGGTGTLDATWLRGDSSFTMNAWVRLDPGCEDPGDPCWDTPGTADQVVLKSKAGATTNMELRYVGSTRRH